MVGQHVVGGKGDGGVVMRQLIASVVSVMVLAAAGTVQAAEKPVAEIVKVFVFTEQNEEGFTDKDSKERTDSVADLQQKIQKKRDLRLVDTRESADLVIEILKRGHEKTGSTTTRTTAVSGTWISRPSLVSKTNADTKMDIAARLSVGSFETVLRSSEWRKWGQPNESILWRVHATAIAAMIEQWLDDNRATVLARRESK